MLHEAYTLKSLRTFSHKSNQRKNSNVPMIFGESSCRMRKSSKILNIEKRLAKRRDKSRIKRGHTARLRSTQIRNPYWEEQNRTSSAMRVLDSVSIGDCLIHRRSMSYENADE